MRKFHTVNVDLGNVCSLQCPACARTMFRDGRNGYEKGKIPGRPLPLSEIESITDYFQAITFCGQNSDPQFHPDFHKILKICTRKNRSVRVHVAATGKPKSWWIQAFMLSMKHDVTWIFGIDGLPKDSHKYRINQDGEFLYEMMVKCAKYKIKTVWSYIVFRYNEDNIQECRDIAKKYGIEFELVNSCRWYNEEMEMYKPSDKFIELSNDFKQQSVRNSEKT